MTLIRYLFLAAFVFLAGCGVSPPRGAEDQKTFVTVSSESPARAIKVLSPMAVKCYRALSGLGNGVEVESNLDPVSGAGSINIFRVGFNGEKEAPDSFWNSLLAHSIVISPTQTGSQITTSGPSPTKAYSLHVRVISWLRGADTCKFEQPPEG